MAICARKAGVASLFIAALILFAPVHAQDAALEVSAKADRIILNLTEQPATSMAITWRTRTECATPQVEYCVTTAAAEVTTSLRAMATTYKADAPPAWHHSTVLKDLQPRTAYAYRVGDGQTWSAWKHFRTLSAEPGRIKFIYFGDLQGQAAQIKPVFDQAEVIAGDADFMLFVGDLAHAPELWDNVFPPGTPLFETIPSVLVPGNHEYISADDGTRTLTPSWRAHFTLPENGPDGYKEQTYFVDYLNLRVVMFNMHFHPDTLTPQLPWLKQTLATAPKQWTIVADHYPLCNPGEPYKVVVSDVLPLLEQYGVDLALSGHIHIYARSRKVAQGKPVADDGKGVMYVTANGGPKMYKLNLLRPELMAKTAENVTTFQVITIEGNRLAYEAYTLDGKVFDSMEMRK